MERWLIHIDQGHGVETPGKRGPILEDGRQLLEHEFNYDIGERIKSSILGLNKVWVNMSRYDEHDVSLQDRVNYANDSYDGFEKMLFVSIHANGGGGTGWEVFTSKGEDESDKYATIFYEEAQKMFPDQKFRKDTSDGDVDKESQFYVLRNTKMPAVLTENFFMDTLSDCEILLSEEGRQKIAQLHINAIKRIINNWENEKRRD